MTQVANDQLGNAKSSGVLCWSCPPGTRDIYFLLGKERKNRKWRQGSNRWSDFGGGAKNNESAFDCATREFVEESLACLQVLHEKFTPMNELASVTKNLLQSKSYSAAFQLFIDKNKSEKNEKEQDEPQKRVCFLKFIPWQPGAPRNFSKMHRYLQRFSNFINKKDTGDTFQNENDHFRAIIKMYEELPYQIQHHPAITVTKHPETRAILSIKVNGDYLEKQQIMWISLPIIEKVLANNGTYNKLLFRRGFLQILKLAVEYLKQLN